MTETILIVKKLKVNEYHRNFQVKRDKSRKGDLSYTVDYRKTRVR
jgi:hypothetical protein